MFFRKETPEKALTRLLDEERDYALAAQRAVDYAESQLVYHQKRVASLTASLAELQAVEAPVSRLTQPGQADLSHA